MQALTLPFRNPDLRNKILITVALLAAYRLGALLPLPGVSYSAVKACTDAVAGNSLYDMVALFGGGALLKLSVFALGIMPYITASIIMQLLGVVIPRLDHLRKEGQAGQATLTQYTRYVTVGLSVLQGVGIIALARTPGTLFQGCTYPVVPDTSLRALAAILLAATAGSIIVMWIGENITERGIGNGMSLLIFTSIAATLPAQIWGLFTAKGYLAAAIVAAVAATVILIVVYVEQAQRRIPIQFPGRTSPTARRAGPPARGATSYLPFKVNMAGVVPVIFASSLMFIPKLFVNLTGSQAGWAQWVSRNFSTGTEPIYLAVYVALIVFFAYFYVAITVNPTEQADNLAKAGGFIPGIRPGKPTATYLEEVLNRLTFPGSLYLAAIAALPIWVFGWIGGNQNFLFGGTSVLILVGVALDTLKQINAQTEQRNYKGFLK